MIMKKRNDNDAEVSMESADTKRIFPSGNQPSNSWSEPKREQEYLHNENQPEECVQHEQQEREKNQEKEQEQEREEQLKAKLNTLISQTPTDEQLLVASLLLTRSSPATVLHCFIANNSNEALGTFVERMFRHHSFPLEDGDGNDDALVYARIGVRLLTLLYDPDNHRQIVALRRWDRDMRMVSGMLSCEWTSKMAGDNTIDSHSTRDQKDALETKLDRFCVEAMDLLNLIIYSVLEGLSHHGSGITTLETAGVDTHTLAKIPELLLRIYLDSSSRRHRGIGLRSTGIDPDTITQDEGHDADLTVVQIIESVLNYNVKHKKREDEINIKTTYENRMGTFLLQHLHLLQRYSTSLASPKDGENERIMSVTTQFYLDAIDYITSLSSSTATTVEKSSSSNVGDGTIRSILYRSILHYLTWDANHRTHELTLALNTPSFNTRVSSPLAKSIRRLMIIGISSILDDYDVGPSMESERSTVRNSTLTTLATIVDRCGVGWMRFHRDDFGDDENGGKLPSSLGEGTIFCTIARLVAGELRVSLGSVLDDDNTTSATRGSNDNCARLKVGVVRDCIGTIVSFLQVVLRLADEDDKDSGVWDKENGGIDADSNVSQCHFHLDADALLHTRHSFEDTLDAVVQFLSAPPDELGEGGWKGSVRDECALYCCQFLGAYLSEINIWERQDDDSDVDGSGNVGEGRRKALSSVELMTAVRRGLIFLIEHDKHKNRTKCGVISMESEGKVETFGIATVDESLVSPPQTVSVTTMYPCLITMLNTCREQQEREGNQQYKDIQNVDEYLVRGDVIFTAVLNTLDNCLCHLTLLRSNEKGRMVPALLRDNNDDDGVRIVLEHITWCNMVIETLTDFYTFAQSMVSSFVPSVMNYGVYDRNDSVTIRKLYKSILSCVEEILIILEGGGSSTNTISSSISIRGNGQDRWASVLSQTVQSWMTIHDSFLRSTASATTTTTNSNLQGGCEDIVQDPQITQAIQWLELYGYNK